MVRGGTNASDALAGMALGNGRALSPDGPGIEPGDPVPVILLA